MLLTVNPDLDDQTIIDLQLLICKLDAVYIWIGAVELLIWLIKLWSLTRLKLVMHFNGQNRPFTVCALIVSTFIPTLFHEHLENTSSTHS